MNSLSSADLFETCLQRIQRGAGVNEVLADYPEQAQDLRPMLEAAVELRQLSAANPIPTPAQNRSRARFLSAAAGLTPVQGFKFSFLRFATAGLIVIAILGSVLWGTGWASAQSLPGDMLYPVKIMVEKFQINTVQNGPARLELEEQMDNRRLDEVIQLNRVQRKQPVSFGGLLVLTEKGEWQVGGVTLSFPPAYPPPDILIGTYVQVNGFSNEDVVEVESLSPRQYQWSGVIQTLDAAAWTVSGTQIHLNRDTKISGFPPQNGAMVTVTAIRLADDIFMAVQLEVTSIPAKTATRLASATSPARVAATASSSPERSNSPEPSSRPGSLATLTPAPTLTIQPLPTLERETETTRTPTPLNAAQTRTLRAPESSATIKPSPTRPASTATGTSSGLDEKSSH